MPYLTREDGERFIIPAYRDILSARKPTLLKKEVMLLSASYGQYITLQRKNADQYEAAFSPESGYLLGETVWHFFKRPRDMIYCEAIPNTTDAILVIVKAGSVYLDGSFPIDSIPDELIVFRTQQNYFEIYIHGDIPLSQKPEAGKFSLDASSVKSFNILPGPVFPTLPVIKSFQLRPVDTVLSAQGIGVIPVGKITLGFAIVVIVWMGFLYLTKSEKELPPVFVSVVNPYQAYITMLQSPSPASEIRSVGAWLAKLYTIPGWEPVTVDYDTNITRAKVKSSGSKLNVLYRWTAMNRTIMQIAPDGVSVILPVIAVNRLAPTTISPLQQVIAELLDRIAVIVPGNNLTLGALVDRGKYYETQLTIAFSGLTLDMLDLFAEELRGLPLVLVKLNLTINSGTVSGNLVLKALGN